MRIGVVSDTHAQVQYTQNALRLLEGLQIEQVLHCGDIGSREIVDLFYRWPTHFVFGNVDHYDRIGLQRAIEQAGQTCHDLLGDFTLDGVRIALIHSDDALTFNRVVEDETFQLVCYGHTHVAKIERLGAKVVLNPGAIYRAHPHSLAVVDLPSLDVKILPI